MRAVRFGPWHPLTDAASVAPMSTGVLQARADAVLDYPQGKSAMVFYAGSGSLGLRAYVSGDGAAGLARAERAGARLVRFGETSRPADECARLLTDFERRFGSLPRANNLI